MVLQKQFLVFIVMVLDCLCHRLSLSTSQLSYNIFNHYNIPYDRSHCQSSIGKYCLIFIPEIVLSNLCVPEKH